MVHPIPDGYHTVTPYLSVQGMQRCFDFIRATFPDAVVGDCMQGPDGSLRHADLTIAGSHVMMGECPGERGAMPGMLYLYVTDVDAVFARAVEAGGEVLEPLETKFYGDRTGSVKDACGNCWYFASRVEEVAPEEMQRRMAAQG